VFLFGEDSRYRSFPITDLFSQSSDGSLIPLPDPAGGGVPKAECRNRIVSSAWAAFLRTRRSLVPLLLGWT